MFQNLRPNNQIYILHKGSEPFVEVGSVINVTQSVTPYTIPQAFGGMQEPLVDISVKVGGHDQTFQRLPANADIADFEKDKIVVTTTRDTMNTEVMAYKQTSVDALANRSFHESVIAGCDKILLTINPEFAERKARQDEINELRTQVQTLMEANSALMARLDSGTSKKQKNEEHEKNVGN